jgi:hypothetical protein
VDRRSRLAAFATAAFIAIGAVSQLAMAAPKDAAAKKADQDAMNNDFLMADFPKAEQSLKNAVAICGASGCTPKVKAQILVHLGIVQVNNNKVSDAEASFAEALGLDSSVAPEKDYTTPEIDKAFEAAKAKASGAAAGSSGAAEPGGAAEPSAEELSHDTVPEQLINTPVPLFVTVPEGMTVNKVIVMYKPFGGTWKKLELKKARGGWGGDIPCEDTTTTGDLKYYIKALDASGDQIAGLGSVSKPYVTKIKNQLDGDPPHQPNKPPPAQCRAKEDCPPGFPGCSAVGKRGDKGWGASCEETRECQTGLICKGGVCEEGEEEPGAAGGGPAGPSKKNWVGLYGAFDLALVSGSDVCGMDSQANKGYACFIKDGPYAGDQYHGNPKPSGNGNAIAGGLAPATVRIMAGFDRALGSNFMLGARAGWAFRGGPKPDGGNKFLPFHLELRASYWFGKDPFSRIGFRPFVFIGGGMAQVDTRVDVSVREQDNCGSTGCIVDRNPDPNVTEVIQVNPQTQTVEAWRKSGQSFAGLGGGAMYALSPNGGIVAAIKISQMFPTSGTVISPEVGYAMGF